MVIQFHVLQKTQVTVKDVVIALPTSNACLLCLIVFLNKEIDAISSIQIVEVAKVSDCRQSR